MDETRKVGGSAGNRGKGRKKGVPNRMTKAVKEMILEALDNAGGVDYLVTQSRENPNAFLTLVGKVLPLQVTGPNDGPLEFTHIELVDGVRPDSSPA